jgi:hypothetical protein
MSYNGNRSVAQGLISSLGNSADLLAAHESFPHSPGLIAVASRLGGARASGAAVSGTAASVHTDTDTDTDADADTDTDTDSIHSTGASTGDVTCMNLIHACRSF